MYVTPSASIRRRTSAIRASRPSSATKRSRSVATRASSFRACDRGGVVTIVPDRDTTCLRSQGVSCQARIVHGGMLLPLMELLVPPERDRDPLRAGEKERYRRTNRGGVETT